MIDFIATALFFIAGWLTAVAFVNAHVRAVVRGEDANLEGPGANLALSLVLCLISAALIHFL